MHCCFFDKIEKKTKTKTKTKNKNKKKKAKTCQTDMLKIQVWWLFLGPKYFILQCTSSCAPELHILTQAVIIMTLTMGQCHDGDNHVNESFNHACYTRFRILWFTHCLYQSMRYSPWVQMQYSLQNLSPWDSKSIWIMPSVLTCAVIVWTCFNSVCMYGLTMKSKFLCEKPASFRQFNLWKSTLFICWLWMSRSANAQLSYARTQLSWIATK